MSDTFVFFLAHITNVDGKLNVNASIELDDAFRLELDRASISLNSFTKSNNVAESVIANRNDVLESVVSLGKQCLDFPETTQEMMEYAHFDSSRRLANMCSLFRSFIDHNDGFFKRTYGRNSEVFNNWRILKHECYDECLSYAIISEMRDYIQHYDMPPININLHRSANDDGIRLNFSISTKILMEDKQFCQRIKARLPGIDENIPLIPMLDEWSHRFQTLIKYADDVRIRRVVTSAHLIAGLRSRFFIPASGQIAVVKLLKSESATPVTSLQMGISHLDEIRAERIANEYPNTT